ncbi:Uncharacterised protein [Neisseria gonorrhoeae]|uniref:Uncharacterized protein n=1 Tax=Neisseria gonorrhoeae TaxID=485 RepID=A0A378VXE1_NEIGO|nr:Uncharacterised protein [Neisseria gonorrhoeae]
MPYNIISANYLYYCSIFRKASTDCGNHDNHHSMLALILSLYNRYFQKIIRCYSIFDSSGLFPLPSPRLQSAYGGQQVFIAGIFNPIPFGRVKFYFLPPQTVVAASATARAVWAVAVIFGWASAHCLAELMPSFTAKALSCNRLAAASCASGLKFPKL